MPFEGHHARHREPKGFKVKASRVTPTPGRTLAPVTNAEWRAQQEAKRGRLARLFGRR